MVYDRAKKQHIDMGCALHQSGIAAGIVVLIVVMSVMNGLQHQYIDSLLETTSFHIRITTELSSLEALNAKLRNNSSVLTATPLLETNLLAEGDTGAQAVLRVTWIDLMTFCLIKAFVAPYSFLLKLQQKPSSPG